MTTPYGSDSAPPGSYQPPPGGHPDGAPNPYGSNPYGGAPNPYAGGPGGYVGGAMPPPPPTYGGYPGAQAPVPGGRLAGMGARFGQLVVDTIVLLVIEFAVGVASGGSSWTSTRTCNDNGTCVTHFHIDTTASLISALLSLAYWALLVGLTGQTLGHRAAGIKVVDVKSGHLIGVSRAALRWLVMTVTGVVCTLGYWSPFFDPDRRQGWHDKSASSVVIPARRR